MTKSRDLGNLAQTVAVNLPTSLGSASQTLAVNSGASALEFVDAATGGGGGSLEAVASGTLSDGSTVVINSDGTVSAVSSTTAPQVLGSVVQVDNDAVSSVRSAYDSFNQKVVIIYRKSNSDCRAVVGEVSGTTITFGADVRVVYNATDLGIAFDSNAQKFLIVYKHTGVSNYGTAVVGSVSGNSITFGTAVVFNSNTSNAPTAAYDVAAQKFAVFYNDGSTYVTKAVVATISGTNVSFGTAITPKSTLSGGGHAAVYHTAAQKVVMVCFDFNASYVGYSNVFTISGTSISAGTETSPTASYFYNPDLAYDANTEKVVTTFRDGGQGSRGKAVVGAISGTTVTWGSIETFYTGSISNIAGVAYDASSQKIVIFYRDATNSNYGKYLTASVSGTSITFDTTQDLENTAVNWTTAVYDATQQKIVFSYADTTNSLFKTKVLQVGGNVTTNLTANNFIGISDAAYANGATATVQISGSVDDAQSGLTVGEEYYVQTDGTLSTTPGSPSVLAGKAISSTQLIVNDNLSLTNISVGSNASASGTGGIAFNDTSGVLTYTPPVIPSGGASLEAVASGTLANGDTVIVNSDGTVSAVSGSQTFNAGSSVQWDTAPPNFTDITFDQNANKIIIIFADSSNSTYLTAIVGTVSGTSISFGTPVVIQSAATYFKPKVLYNAANQKVFVYGGQYNVNHGRLWMGTVSGTSITFASSVTPFSFNPVRGFGNDMCYDAASGNLVLIANPGWMELQVVQVSGSTLNLQSTVAFTSNNSDGFMQIESDGNGGILFAYQDYYTGNIRVRAASLSGTTLTLQSGSVADEFSYTFTGHPSLIYLPSVSRFLLVGARTTGLEASLYSVSTSSPISFTRTAGPTAFSTGVYTTSSYGPQPVAAVYYPPISNPYVCYAKNPSYLRLLQLSCTASAITFNSSTEHTVDTNVRFWPSLTYDTSTQQIVIAAHGDFGTSAQDGYAYVVNPAAQTTNLTSNNYIGISDGSYSNGQTATIQINGSVDDAQSGLVPSNKYFVQYDGSLSTSAGNPSVEAGIAVAATKIIVKG